MAAVFTGIVAFGAVFLVIYFVRKRRSPNANDGNSKCFKWLINRDPHLRDSKGFFASRSLHSICTYSHLL